MPIMETVGKLLKSTKAKVLSIGTPPEKKVLYSEITKSDKKIETAREEADRLRAEKIEAQKLEAQKIETQKIETQKVETQKVEAQKVEAQTSTKPNKREIKTALYHKDIVKHYGEVDSNFLDIIVKNLGPSIYRKNSELVSCAEPKELDTVRRNFLIKKLGLSDSKEVLDGYIQEVCQELKGVRQKYRATFYYRLAKKLNKETALS